MCNIGLLKCRSLTIFHRVLHRLARLQSASPPTVFRVVVNEHVVRHSQDMTLHAHCSRHNHLRNRRKVQTIELGATQ